MNIAKIVNESKTVEEAVNRLLSEDMEFGAGDVVAVGHDETFPYDGVRMKVKGPSAKGSGFLDCQAPDGQVIPLQASLLLKV